MSDGSAGQHRNIGGQGVSRTDDPEVLVEAVADEDAAEVDQQPQLLVCDLERYEGMSGNGRVEVTSCAQARQYDGSKTRANCRTSDARELGEVVDDGVARVDVVVNERDARVGPLASQDGHAGERHAARADDLLRPVRVKLGFLLRVATNR